jgi:hypothetical protein
MAEAAGAATDGAAAIQAAQIALLTEQREAARESRITAQTVAWTALTGTIITKLLSWDDEHLAEIFFTQIEEVVAPDSDHYTNGAVPAGHGQTWAALQGTDLTAINQKKAMKWLRTHLDANLAIQLQKMGVLSSRLSIPHVDEAHRVWTWLTQKVKKNLDNLMSKLYQINKDICARIRPDDHLLYDTAKVDGLHQSPRFYANMLTASFDSLAQNGCTAFPDGDDGRRAILVAWLMNGIGGPSSKLHALLYDKANFAEHAGEAASQGDHRGFRDLRGADSRVRHPLRLADIGEPARVQRQQEPAPEDRRDAGQAATPAYDRAHRVCPYGDQALHALR